MKGIVFGIGLAGIVTMAAGCVATTGAPDDEESLASEGALSPSCEMVKCALPICSEGQHLSYSGGDCCPSCEGPTSKCAAVLCPLIKCAPGYQAVTPKGQCCAKCMKTAPVAQCTVDSDCPQLYCIACPCPVSECVGRTCRTSTPDASTCGELP
ncbi:MAG: hypothetical protein HYZ29_00460 [Myxococcales bacterium]|nr:hypothetical protein [Myxococcales bacterium]